MKFAITIAVVTIVVMPALTYAQQFNTKTGIKLPSGTKPVQAMWVDIDNDSLLDVVVIDTSSASISSFAFSGWLNGSIAKHALTAPILLSLSSINRISSAVTDLNQDNKMDLVLSNPSSGKGTQAFLNTGNFSFEQQQAAPGSFAASKMDFTDFNNDGRRDLLVIQDSSSLKLFKNNKGIFELTISSGGITVTDFSIFDFDGNGFQDIAVSGKDSSNNPILSILEFKNNFDTLRTISIPTSNYGILACGDLNHDGLFDLIVSGQKISGTWVNQSFINNGLSFNSGKQYPGIKATRVDIADFTSDGKTDVSLFGEDLNGNTAHWIFGFTGDSLQIPSTHVVSEIAGDYDRDGDLDILQLNDTLGLILLENTEVAKNKGPAFPTALWEYTIYSRLFAYWNPSSDDHTPSPALTYDVEISANGLPFEDSEFNNKTGTRLTVTNGNQGANNFILLKYPGGIPTMAVEPIDNSYTTSHNNFISSGSIPVVSGPGSCSITYKDISVCNSDSVTISANGIASWFSFSDGFEGKHNTLKIANPATDTVFSFVPPANGGCPIVTVYTITVSQKDTIRQTLYFSRCVGGSVKLSMDEQWQLTAWTNKHQVLSSDNPFTYFPTMSGPIIGIGRNSYDCFLSQTNNITISIPVLKLAAADYEIFIGQSVQLNASGGQTYQWLPPDGLDNPSSPDPMATPLLPTTYTVAITDSIGCTAKGIVFVNTIQSAFLPSLFSPNGDSKNDELLIYGLISAQAFRFSIFNREGATVYETSDITSASGEGWNGRHNGSPQPAGIYYWKVEGQSINGQALQLNGKKQGSVMLVR